MTHDSHFIQRRFILAMALTALILVAEVIGGLWTGSLALLSDAAHVLMDILALAMSYAAVRIATRPADERHTYGYYRWQVLAALANGITLFVVALGIFREAWQRFNAPDAVLAGPMLVVAVIGLVANVAVALALSDHDHGDLNVRSAFLHVLGDTLSSVGVILAGGIILFTGWDWVDPLASVLIGGIILLGSGRLLHEALHILVEGTPEGASPTQVSAAMHTVPGVSQVHDLHVWTVSPGYVALSAHVVLEDQRLAETQRVQEDLRRVLSERFGIRHATVQIECDPCGEGAWPCTNEG